MINLASRTDRRREMEAELRKVGASLEAPTVTLFPAVRPDGPGAFPSVGARGCFLSHLGVLRMALQAGHRQILVLEDDADFTPLVLKAEGADVLFQAEDWGMAYLGHHLHDPSPLAGVPPTVFAPLPPAAEALGAHAVLIRRPVIEQLVPYLEAMLARPGGDPAGGPMHLDGAYNWLRSSHPEIRVRLSGAQWVVQRASRTDIGQTGWKERLPLIGPLRRLRNRLRLRS